mgnify:FL=1
MRDVLLERELALASQAIYSTFGLEVPPEYVEEYQEPPWIEHEVDSQLPEYVGASWDHRRRSGASPKVDAWVQAEGEEKPILDPVEPSPVRSTSVSSQEKAS